ncbi:MAG: efflux RND transporter periplasmic adaptor subunit [Maribacter sp.]
MKSFQKLPFILIVIVVMACGDSTNTYETKNKDEAPSDVMSIQITKTQFDNSAMQLGKITEQPFPKVVQTTGMIDVPPQNRAVISTFAGGYVQKTPLLVGNKVRKGQVLVTLENPEFVEMQQNYLENAEQLTFLKSEYDRQKTLMEEKITSQKNFLKAESDYNRALAMYNGLKKKLQMLNINTKSVEEGLITSVVTLYAPIDGSVTKMNVTNGAYVSPADEIMEIINTDHIHLELAVFEKDILKVKEGQKILFKIPEAVENSFEAEVHLVGTSIDTKNRTVKVHGHLDDDRNHSFAVGMFVDAQIITESKKELALPNDAIVSRDTKNFVLVNVADNANSYSLNQKEIIVGDSFNGFTMIKNKDDFNENDSFLVKGAFNLIQEEN